MTDKVKNLILGGGPAGYCAAIRLAQLNQECLLVEKNKVGGTCLNVGCIPSKALIHASSQYDKIVNDTAKIGISCPKANIDWAKTIDWKTGLTTKIVKGVEFLLKKNQVQVISGTGELLDNQTVQIADFEKEKTYPIKADNILLATGSSIIELPAFPFDHQKILNSTDLLELTKLPKSMIILGGGIIGCELGSIYGTLGVKVSIVEMLDRVLMPFEKQAVQIIEKKMRAKGVDFYTSAKALSAKTTKDNVVLKYQQNAKELELTAELLAVAVGRKANTKNLNLAELGIKEERGQIVINDRFQTSVSNIYAVGDLVNGPALAHKASAEAIMAAEIIAGKKRSRQDLKVIPNVLYTKPEIATVGLSEEQAEQNNLKIKVGKFPLSALGKSATVGESEGYLKYIANSEDDRILGAVIVSSIASELIGQAGLAIEMGACLDDLAMTIQAHPSFSEAHLEAAAAAQKEAIHIINT